MVACSRGSAAAASPGAAAPPPSRCVVEEGRVQEHLEPGRVLGFGPDGPHGCTVLV
jgi:hypothetical protein